MVGSVDWSELRKKIDLVKKEYDRQYELHPNPQMCSLLILGEDHRFYSHPGFDPAALGRAAWRTFICGRREGGSTIAMQLARTLTRRYERTILRKAREVVLAVRITQYIPKEDLPGLYLWVAYYGWRMNSFLEACDRLGIDPTSHNLYNAARLVARLKYPQPRTVSYEQLCKIEQRCFYLVDRYNRSRRKLTSISETCNETF